MKCKGAILAVAAALAVPALAWADEQVPDEQVPYDWSKINSVNIQKSRESRSPKTTVPKSDESSGVSNADDLVHFEPVAGDNA